jgi:octaprenyl-diphosphate synthase
MDLKQIYKPIENELKAVENKLFQALDSKDRFIFDVGKYVLKARGKLMRPALVLLSSKSGSGVPEKAIGLAASIELIHTATLVHDDVIDQAKMRRNQPSLNVKFGKDNSILFGDYLYSKAFGIISSLNIPRMSSVLLKATNALCQGEMRQLNKTSKARMKVGEYLGIISDKTASLFSACCEAGGFVSGATTKQIQVLKKYGHDFGMSFQIIDDCLDLVGNEEEVGKTLKLDEKCGKMTLPMIYLSGDNAMTERDAVDRAMKLANDYSVRAVESLGKLDNKEIVNHLVKLVEYSLSRVN